MRHALGLMAALAMVLNCRQLAAQEMEIVKFADAIGQLVISPTSGVAASIDTQKMMLYPRLSSEHSLEEAFTVKMAGKPVAICHKPTKTGGIFIAADDKQTIYVFNDATGNLLGSVNVGVEVTDVSAPPTADSNVVFYVTRNSQRRAGAKLLGRLDVAAIKNLGMLSTPELLPDEFIIEAAADGLTVYLSGPNSGPTGIYALRQENEERVVALHQDMHDGVASYVPLASGVGTAMNNRIRTPDLQSTLRELPGFAICAMRSRPVIFCQSNDRTGVIAASANTGKPLGRVAFNPKQIEAANRGRPVRTEQIRLRKLKRWGGVDEANQNLILNSTKSAIVIPLASFHLPDEAMMTVRVEGPTDLVTDEPWKAKIVNASKDVQITLTQAPQGMKLVGDTLTWTPSSSAVGAARVMLELRGKDVKTEQQLDLTVRQPWIKLPFAVGSYADTPDGSKLIIVPEDGTQGESRTSRIAGLELATGKVLFDKQLDFRLSALDASNDTVYMGALGAAAIYSMNIKNPQEVNKTFTEGEVHILAVAANRLCAYLKPRNSNYGMTLYTLPTLKPMELPFPAWMDGQEGKPPLVDVASGWRLGEAVWTPDFSKVKLLLVPRTVPALNLGSYDAQQHWERVVRWGTVAQDGYINRLSGQSIVQRNELIRGTILVDLPAAAFLSIKTAYNKERQATMTQTDLVVLDLMEGHEDRLPLMYERENQIRLNNDESRYPTHSKLFSQPGKVFAIVADRMFVISTKSLPAQRFAEPLFFEAEQNPVLASGKGPVKVAYKVRGGKKPLRFSLANDAPGLEINSSSGEVTIDPQKLLSDYRLISILDQYLQWGTNQRGPQPVNLLQLAAKQIQAVQYWTGLKPAGIPVAVRIGVRVRDASQQEAVLEHAILLDMPAQVLQNAYAERQRQMRAK